MHKEFTAPTGDELEDKIKEFMSRPENQHITRVREYPLNLPNGVAVLVVFDTTLGVCDEEVKKSSRFPILSDVIIAILFGLAIIIVTPLALIARLYDAVYMFIKNTMKKLTVTTNVEQVKTDWMETRAFRWGMIAFLIVAVVVYAMIIGFISANL